MSTPRSNINQGGMTSRSSINSAIKARKNNLKTYKNGPGQYVEESKRINVKIDREGNLVSATAEKQNI